MDDINLHNEEMDFSVGGDGDPYITLAILIFNCIYKNLPTDKGRAEFKIATEKSKHEISVKVTDFLRMSYSDNFTIH